MRLQLRPHPDTPCDDVSSIVVEVEFPEGDNMVLRYALTGAIARLVIPPAATPVRTNELWRRTCFEAFLRPGDGEAYVEFNFAPSTQWAAYRFAGYREGMAPAEIAAPLIEVTTDDTTLELAGRLNLAALSLPPGLCRVALCAVVEAESGAKSYWALAHPPGRPDFHHRSSFACELRKGTP